MPPCRITIATERVPKQIVKAEICWNVPCQNMREGRNAWYRSITSLAMRNEAKEQGPLFH